jgi:hypothetical protein
MTLFDYIYARQAKEFRRTLLQALIFIKRLWGGLKWFFSKDQPLQANLELAFFLPQRLFSHSLIGHKSWQQQNRKIRGKHP